MNNRAQPQPSLAVKDKSAPGGGRLQSHTRSVQVVYQRLGISREAQSVKAPLPPSSLVSLIPVSLSGCA